MGGLRQRQSIFDRNLGREKGKGREGKERKREGREIEGKGNEREGKGNGRVLVLEFCVIW